MTFISAEFVNHKNQVMNFRWRILDRGYARRWLEVMKAWKASWPSAAPNWIEKWFVAATDEDFSALLDSLRKHVEKVDQLGAYTIGFNMETGKDVVAELNRLHRAFHQYIERTDLDLNNTKVIETINLCHRMNDLVHLCEAAYQNTLSPFQSFCIIGTGQPHMQVPYETEDFKFCTTSRVSGWLYLGYATPGKTLFQCFEDQDAEVVHHRLVRPSQGIANEFHFELQGQSDFDSGRDEEIRKKYYEWCDKIGAEKFGYNCRDEVNNPGRIPLAEPVDDISRLLHHIGGRIGYIKSLDFGK